MNRRCFALPCLVLAVLAAGGTAMAQTASTPPPPPPPAPVPLSGLTVAAPAKTPPMVVSTFPEAGKAVAPGALILKVTFDQKMTPDGWDYSGGAERYPQCLARPRLLADEKTFVLLCTAGASTQFSVRFNATSAGGFQNLAGQRATPAALDFSTSGDQALSTIDDAMKAASLKKDEGPVMDRVPAKTVAAAAAPPP
jgi:hypothetical protein